MSQESTTELSTTGAGAGKPSPDPLVFFQTILVNMTSKLEVIILCSSSAWLRLLCRELPRFNPRILPYGAEVLVRSTGTS
jgi:hypothetical protein